MPWLTLMFKCLSYFSVLCITEKTEATFWILYKLVMYFVWPLKLEKCGYVVSGNWALPQDCKESVSKTFAQEIIVWQNSSPVWKAGPGSPLHAPCHGQCPSGSAARPRQKLASRVSAYIKA